MNDSREFNRKLMLTLAIAVGVILSAFTAALVLLMNGITKQGFTIYVVIVPIFFSVFAFILSYIDMAEDSSEGEIAYYRKRGFVFGGLMSVMTFIVICLLFLAV